MTINIPNTRKISGLVVCPSSLDKKLIKNLRVINDDKSEKITSKKKIIKKPWGFEYPCYQNKYLDIWQFHLYPQSSTSFHCHPNKDALKIVLEGKITFETVKGKEILSAGDTRLVKAFTLHKTFNNDKEIARVLEIESPPDKRNLIRVNDFYGRQKLPYIFEPLESSLAKDILVNSFFRENNRKISENFEIFQLTSAKPIYTKNIVAEEILGLRLKKNTENILLKNLPLEFSGKTRRFLLVLDGILMIKDQKRSLKMLPGDCCSVSDIKHLNVLSGKTDTLIW